MKKLITLLIIYLLSSPFALCEEFEEIKKRYEVFFSSIDSAESSIDIKHIEENIDHYLDDILRAIKKLPYQDPKRLQLEGLGASLGHGKKKKALIFHSRNAHISPRPPFLDIPLNQGTKRKTFRHVVKLWLTTPHLLNKDILVRLHNLFEGGPNFIENDDALEKEVLLIYPDHSNSVFRYHPWPVILDPEKIHSLQLISVEGGDSISNAFGHSALRIVMCDPQRKEISDACLHDVAFHIVLSFRAEIEKKEITTPLKGIAGSYPSRAFLMPLNDVLEQYLEKEGRTIITIPLLLDRNQINQFVTQLIKIGRQERPYEFFSNNCATEIWSFLQTIIVHPAMFSNTPLSPQSVIKSLQKTGAVNKDPSLGRKKTANELWQREQEGLAFMPYDAKQIFFFQSLKKILKRNHIALPLTLLDLESQNPSERLSLYKYLLQTLSSSTFFEDIDQHLHVAMVLIINIEQEIGRKLQKLLNSEALLYKSSTDFNQSENEISEMSAVIFDIIKDYGNQIIIKNKSNLDRFTKIQAEIRDRFTKNGNLKRQLALLVNEQLSAQEDIFHFFMGQISDLAYKKPTREVVP